MVQIIFTMPFICRLQIEAILLSNLFFFLYCISYFLEIEKFFSFNYKACGYHTYTVGGDKFTDSEIKKTYCLILASITSCHLYWPSSFYSSCSQNWAFVLVSIPRNWDVLKILKAYLEYLDKALLPFYEGSSREIIKRSKVSIYY